ncbi:MAG TPA: hypothetical protein ENI23_03835 [bacterium]|nr:hypothetical protein [bacterium]
MTDKERRLANEVVEKWKLARDKKDEDNFTTSVDKWEDYYAGESDELKERKKRELSAIMPPWAQAGVDYVLAKEIAVIFGQKPYWTVGARQKKWEEAAKLMEQLLSWQLDTPKVFLNVVEWIQHKLIYGTAIRKPYWDRENDEVKIEQINIKNFYPSPDGYSIYTVPWVIQRALRTKEYIKAMGKPWRYSNKPTYKNTKELLDLPGGEHVEEHVEESEGSIRTVEEKLNLYEILEYWYRRDGEVRVATVGARKVLLRDSVTPYKKKKKDFPYMVAIDWPKPKSFWGTGRIEAIEPHVKELAHIKNQRFDNINLILNPPFKYVTGTNIDLDALPIKPNALIGMDDIDSLQPLIFPFVTQGVYTEAAEIENDIQNRLGLHEYSMGKAPEQRETATGIARLQAAGNTIFQFQNMMSLKLAMTELADWMSAINQQYFKHAVSLPFLYDSEGRGQYLTIIKSRLQGDLYFEPKVAPLNPESVKDVQRQQFVTAVQTAISMQANLRRQELARVLFEKFDLLDSDIEKIIPPQAEMPPGSELPPEQRGQPGQGRGAPTQEGLIAGTAGAGLGTNPPKPR